MTMMTTRNDNGLMDNDGQMDDDQGIITMFKPQVCKDFMFLSHFSCFYLLLDGETTTMMTMDNGRQLTTIRVPLPPPIQHTLRLHAWGVYR
jgi:hypothetical protein